MGVEATFEVWLKYVFDRPVTDPAWYYNVDEPLEIPAASYIQNCTRLFSGAAEHLRQFSDAQVNQG
jgi:hypothetical protein